LRRSRIFPVGNKQINGIVTRGIQATAHNTLDIE
jgi:hypothetical protein